VSRRAKLLEKMGKTPANIRFAQVNALLRHEGFVVFNKRGSHRAYHHTDGRLITIVVPHGNRKTCHRDDIQRLLEVLGL
jgi:predicted RNA binding protein YcfA (HicA-like mRNA interferase family)